MAPDARRIRTYLTRAGRALAARLRPLLLFLGLATVSAMLMVSPTMGVALHKPQVMDGNHGDVAVDAGAAASAWAAAGPANTSVMLAPLYLRIPEPELLNSSLRSDIYSAVQQNPGATFTEIRSQTGAAAGTVQHHLRVLERGGVLRRIRAGKFTRFYPANQRATRLSPPEERIARALSDVGPTTQASLGRMLGMSRQLVHYHVEHMEGRGIVAREGAVGASVIRLAVPLTPERNW